MDRVAIVGASAGGLASAEALRRQGYEGLITLVGDEPHLPYDRPPLSKQILTGEWGPDRLPLRARADIDALGLDLRLGRAATGVNVPDRSVTLADGESIGYDALIVATGVRPRRLPGSDGVRGVHVLRDLEDALALKEQFLAGRRLVVVGAGFIGAEAASAARGLGLAVTVLEPAPVPLAHAVGEDIGRALTQVHLEHGVDLRTGTMVRRILSSAGAVTAVELADGTVVPADLVVVGIGSLPNTEWLEGSGLPLDNGLLCDEFSEAAPGVYGVGDVARWYNPLFGTHMRVEHRTNAAEQGLAVARNLLCEDPRDRRPFAPVPYFWSDQYELKIQAYGHLRGHDEVAVVEGDLATRRFIAAYRTGDRLTGALAVGVPPKALRPWRAALAAGHTWDEATGASAAARPKRPPSSPRPVAEGQPVHKTDPAGFTIDRPATAPLDPPPSHLQLRAEQRFAPVAIHDGRLHPYLVTRYEDARAVLGSDAFSTDPSPRPGMPAFPGWREGQPQGPRGFFKNYDEPVHSHMRKALTREFMVKRINAMRPGIERLTVELLDEMTGQGPSADLVEQFALPLPSLVICDLLGVPYEDHDFFQRRAKVFVDLSVGPEDVVQAQQELGEYLDKLVARKRAEPGDDVVTRLAEQVDSGAISARDAADLAAFVLFAGHETTANMIALSVVALLHNPDQIPALLAGPQEAANAVEELLRYLTIVHGGVRRYAVKEVEIAGVTLQPGDGVVVPLGLANRDPEIFGDPDRLDLARVTARRHVAFSYGIHQCLGQPLARAELQIVLPEIFRRLPKLRITVPLEEIDFKQNTFVYGINTLPVAW